MEIKKIPKEITEKALAEFHALQNDDENFKQTWGNTDLNFEEWFADNYYQE